ncbi:hypothetical protein ACG2K1_06745 [Neisseria sp. 23W00296]|uniref:hypothetical protein n=1 Tax=unclassified Neisseria TaxID=2623750 RepID=UPI0002A1DFDF|nr:MULTISPECIES: hypothetical protein [unclassified Neisseria]ASP16672.1 hypothetical protein CGZ77_02320 [Neisseria sp. KEM232]EKY02468.1 hypothetical protein HMPREF9120_02904 [Neisseria sp. oral taxon 020 str. F0370]
MEVKDIPQDNSTSYHGHRKVIYGTRGGHYEAATSSGWDDESYATGLAVSELDAQTQAAREAVARGEYSPLYYHMFRYRHDETSLAGAAGVWKWQLRRHLRPEIFAKLSSKTLQKYANALQINIKELQRIDTDAPCRK